MQAFRCTTTTTTTPARYPNNSTNQEVKLTDAGRTVYGGGGITPDEKIESPKSNHFQDELLYKDVFFHFAPVYVANHTVDKNFQVDDAVLAEFKRYLTSQNIDLDRCRPDRSDGLAEGQHQGQDRDHPVRAVAGLARRGPIGTR